MENFLKGKKVCGSGDFYFLPTILNVLVDVKSPKTFLTSNQQLP